MRMTHKGCGGRVKLAAAITAAAMVVLLLTGLVIHQIGVAAASSRTETAIHTVDDMRRYLLNVDSGDYDPDGHYVLQADLDVSGLGGSIGASYRPFTGIFDGNGYVLSGLDRPLFGVTEGAKIRDLLLDNVCIQYPATYFDGTDYVDGYAPLAAYAVDTEVRDCAAVGVVYVYDPVFGQFEVEPEPVPTPALPSPTPAPLETPEPTPETETSQPTPDAGSDTETPGPTPETETPEPTPEVEPAPETPAPTPEESLALPDQTPDTGDQGEAPSPSPDSEKPIVTEPPAESSPEASSSPETGAEAPVPGDGGSGSPEPDPPNEAAPLSMGGGPRGGFGMSLSNLSHAPAVKLTAYSVEAIPAAPIPLAPAPADPGAAGLEPEEPAPTIPDAENAQPSVGPSNDADTGDDSYTPAPNISAPPPLDMPPKRGYITVQATAITAGGLVAQAEGGTLLSNSFTVITLGSGCREAQDILAGGFAGALGEASRAENSFSTGLVDCGMAGGFAGKNDGVIQNCFTTASLGANCDGAAAFVAVNAGALPGCAYDRQMSCVQDGAALALSTAEMVGALAELPGGNWYRTENAYPQIDFFANQINPLFVLRSKAAAVAILLPENASLDTVLGKEESVSIEIALPAEIDGEPIAWSADGAVAITEEGKAVLHVTGAEAPEEPEPPAETQPATDIPGGGTAQPPEEDGAAEEDVLSIEEPAVPLAAVPEEGPEEEPVTVSGSITATVGDVSRTRTLSATAMPRSAATYADWNAVGEALATSGTVTRADGTVISVPTAGSDGVYEISGPEQLAWLAYRTNTGANGADSLSARLTADIDLTGGDYGGSTDTPLQWTPIGKDATNYYGGAANGTYAGTVFDGGGHTVDYMRVSVGSYGGLFGCTHNCTIRNVTIGANSAVSGSGLVGSVAGGFEEWSSTNTGMLIQDCINYGSVSGNAKVGGIIGDLPRTNVTYAMERCANFGTVRQTGSSTPCSGGLVGQAGNNGINICLNAGALTFESGSNTSYCGGISGQGGRVYNSLNVGSQNKGAAISSSTNSGSRSNSYYISTLGAATKDGTAKTEAQLKSWGAAWALNGGKLAGGNGWVQTAGAYPVPGKSAEPLRAAADWGEVGAAVDAGFISGKPTQTGADADSAYQIGSPEALAWFAYTVNAGNTAKYATLTADIDLFGRTYTGAAADATEIGNALQWKPMDTFSGTFDGGQHALKNFYINAAKGNQGFIIEMTSTGLLKNLGVASGSVSTGDNHAATLATYLKGGTVTRCWNAATVTNTGPHSNVAGGLVGYSQDGGIVTDCYNSGRVVGSTADKDCWGGGIVGFSYFNTSAGKLANCYNTGAVSGFSWGGITTADTGNTVSNCYTIEGAVDSGAHVSNVVTVTAAQLKSWSAAWALNGGSRAGAWNADSGNLNGGYPVLDETGLRPVNDWSEVGAGVDAGFITGTGFKPSEVNGAYQIATPEALAWFAYKTAEGTYASSDVKLTAAIDLFGGTYTGAAKTDATDPAAMEKALRWVPIGENYWGSFDGGNQPITSLHIDADATSGRSKFGLIGFAYSTIQNVVINSGYVNGGSQSCVGAVVGDGGGSVTGCVNKAAVTGKNSVGGIVGSGPSVKDCINFGDVSGTSEVGGILGGSYGGVSSSYSTGKVSGTSDVGHIASNGNVSSSYYLNTNTIPGAADAAVAIGVTEAQLKSWGAAYALNERKFGTTGMTWALDDPENPVNGGYPVFGASLRAANDWGEVGEAVDAGFISGKPAQVGDSAAPYQLDSAEGLAWFAYTVNQGNADKCATLTADIDLFGRTYTGAAEGETDLQKAFRWPGIGGNNDPGAPVYSGTFDGGGKLVTSIYMKNTEVNTGFFRLVDGATVKNLRLDRLYYDGNGSLGGVVGRTGTLGAYITGCAVLGGTLKSSEAQNGGILGNGNGPVTIQQCGNAAAFIGPSGNVGGVVGRYGIDTSTAATLTITDCYNTGALTGANTVGGILGYTTGNVGMTNCYNAGTITGSMATRDAIAASIGVGATVTYTNNYYLDACGCTSSRGASKTADQLKTWGAVFGLNGQSLTGAWSLDDSTAPVNGGYPVFGALRAAADWGEVGLAVENGFVSGRPDLTVNEGSTEAKAIRIDTPAALAWFAYKANNDAAYQSKFVKLTGDADLYGREYTGVGTGTTDITGALRWLPISVFKGTFDGGDYGVSGFYVNETASRKGFFGELYGTVKNLTLSGKVTSTSTYVGGLAGFGNSMTVTDCTINVDVNGALYVGGILGEYNEGGTGTFTRCANLGSVTSTGEAGGVVGTIYKGTGLNITDCYNRGAITTTAASGSTGYIGAGGIVGAAANRQWLVNVTVTNCYSTGALSGINRYGITSTAANATKKNCYYDVGACGAVTQTPAGVTGVTTAQLQSWGAAWALNGGSRIGAWNADSGSSNGGYPVLDATGLRAANDWSEVGVAVDAGFMAGKPTQAGDSSAPYEIATPEALAWFGYTVNAGNTAKCATLTDNIDLLGAAYTGKTAPGTDYADCLDWAPIGSSANKYAGVFNGGGKYISNLYINRGGADTGLFGHGAGATITDVGLRSGAVTGGSNTGALAGWLEEVSSTNTISTVRRCYNAGVTVNSTGNQVAGLIGYCIRTEVSDCYNLAPAAGSGTMVGGIVGSDSSNATGGSIKNCYNTGKITGGGKVGAIVGWHDPRYSMGNNYYLAGTAASGIGSIENVSAVASQTPLSVTETQLKSWPAGFALNGQSLSGTWVMDNGGSNGGYPIFGSADLRPANDWSEVGAAVDGGFISGRPTQTGADTDPYQLDSAEDLAWFAYTVSQGNAGKWAVLTANADLTGTAYGGKEDEPLLWPGIGTATHPYTGAFTGGSFAEGTVREIDHMRMVDTTSNYGVGFFSVVGGGAEISGLGVGASSTITGLGGVGAIVGYVMRSEPNSFHIADCYNRAALTVTGTKDANSGGIVGYCDLTTGVTIERCYNAGALHVSNTGAGYNFVGGIVGVVRNEAVIRDCYNTGAVTSVVVSAPSYPSGIVGHANSGVTKEQIQITRCYNTGAVGRPIGGNDAVNAVVGSDNYYLENSNSTVGNGASVTAAQLRSWGAAFGLNGQSLTGAWGLDDPTAPVNGGYPVFGALRGAADWAEVGAAVDVGFIEAKPTGDGSSGAPYQIGSEEELAWFAYHVNSDTANFGHRAALTADVDLTGTKFSGTADTALNWVSIGGDSTDRSTGFHGSFDGQGHAISNLSIVKTDLNTLDVNLYGLFSKLVGGAAISDLRIQNANIQAAGTQPLIIGVLAGEANGKVTIERVGVENATVTATGGSTWTLAGGVVGNRENDTAQAAGSFTMQNCYARGTTVAATANTASDQVVAAGLVNNYRDASVITNNYFQGNVTATNSGAGRVGAGVVVKRYGGNVTNLFYDKDKSAITVNGSGEKAVVENGKALTTAQLQSWGAAWALNGGGRAGVWNTASGGYPVLDAAGLRAANNWAEVGAAVDAGFMTGKPTGDGSSGSPYQLGSAEQLACFMYMVNSNPSGNKGACAAITAAIDLTGTGYGGSAGVPLQWVPISAGAHGNAANQYSGTFDGGGYVIQNLYIMNTSAAGSSGHGLFAFASNGVIKNVLLENVQINARSSGYVTVGAIVSQIVQNQTVENCGVISGSIQGSANTANMVGGLVGDIHNKGSGCTIRNCFSRATSSWGGLVGRADKAFTFQNCYFAGQAPQALVGLRNFALTTSNLYYLSGVTNSTGVTATAVTGDQLKSWGAVFGLNGQSLTGAWGLDDTTTPVNGGYPVFSAADLRAANDWSEVGAGVDAGFLAGKPTQTGDSAAPYQIGTPEALAWFAYTVNAGNTAKCATLTANIDLSGATYTGATISTPADYLDWTPIGSTARVYTGAFNGGGFEVDHMYIYLPEATGVGFIGYQNNAAIQKLGIGPHSAVTGKGGVGGVAGGGPVSSVVNISNCYNRATITAGVYSGGIYGDDEGSLGTGTIKNCYNSGRIIRDDTLAAGATTNSLGAVAGNLGAGSVVNCWYDSATSGIDKGIGANATTGKNEAAGVTTAQLKSWGAVFGLNGQSLTGPWGLDSANANGGYPVFSAADLRAANDWSEVGAGVDVGFIAGKPTQAGTSAAPYQIGAPEALAWFAYTVNQGSADRWATLTSNIDLFGETYTGRSGAAITDALKWTPMGSDADGKRYSGTLDGGGGSVTNLYVQDTTDRTGFFRVIQGGTVKGLTLSGIVTSTNDYVGGLTGQCRGVTLSDCTMDVAVTGRNYVGGFVGEANDGNDTVTRCVNLGKITGTGTKETGGISGSQWGSGIMTVTDCYNLGDISGGTSAGIVAMTSRSANKSVAVNNCYSAGKSSYGIACPRSNLTVTNSYYDKTLAGGDLGTAKTTAEMKGFQITQLLNGTDRTGAGRLWYAASDNAVSKGYPCFATTAAGSSLSLPITDAATAAYATGTAAAGKFLYFEEVADADFALQAAPAITLTAKDTLTANYKVYGTTNANAKLGFTLDGQDLSSAARNTAAGSGTLTLYNAAAYNHAGPRYFVLGVDVAGTVNESLVTIPAVTSKVIDITVPVGARITLEPGVKDEAYTQSLEIKNNKAYPIDLSITSVTPLSGSDVTHTLTPVAKSVPVTEDEAWKGNVRLAITDPEGGSTLGTLIFYDPDKGTIPLTGGLGSGGIFAHRYFMDYGVILGSDGKFGYNVAYTFAISAGDRAVDSVELKQAP